jgi:hypothetical protein
MKYTIHTLLWFICSVSDLFLQNLLNIIVPKTFKLWTWNFDTIFTSPCISCVKCHVSCVTCNVSHVTYHALKNYKWVVLLVGGTDINGANFV